MGSTPTSSDRVEAMYGDMRRRSEAMAIAREAAEKERLSCKLAHSVPERYRDSDVSDRTCAEWLSRYIDGARRNLVMVGPNGTGKTTNAYGIFIALMRMGVNCTFGTMGAHLRSIKGAYDGGYSERDAIDALCGVPVLFVDDLCKERPSDWASEQAFEVFNARAEKRLPVVVTTNSSSGEIAAHFGAAGNAIVSRIVGGAAVAKFAGRDGRVCSTN